jgi:hypothetical protein
VSLLIALIITQILTKKSNDLKWHDEIWQSPSRKALSELKMLPSRSKILPEQGLLESPEETIEISIEMPWNCVNSLDQQGDIAVWGFEQLNLHANGNT